MARWSRTGSQRGGSVEWPPEGGVPWLTLRWAVAPAAGYTPAVPSRSAHGHATDVLVNSFELRPIGRVESTLHDRSTAPRQPDEGAPPAWLVFDPEFADGLYRLSAGETVLLFTWLDRARREVLRVTPRRDASRGEHGVFATRSPDR